ncbi:MAG TPA: hypothetical protein VH307_20295, partial [Streptosporangiaceae bacterium]|nr:hypothetical protein [Streptosporangiaceae bacterium]
MGFRGPRVLAGERLTASARGAALAAGVLALAAGCGSPSGAAAKAAGTVTPCGMTRTAANVPVSIQVARGQVSCATALTVERDYARFIAAGKAPGNGGGGPVHIRGWTCEGFPTPIVLRTGQASKCVQGDVEILAILPAPA